MTEQLSVLQEIRDYCRSRTPSTRNSDKWIVDLAISKGWKTREQDRGKDDLRSLGRLCAWHAAFNPHGQTRHRLGPQVSIEQLFRAVFTDHPLDSQEPLDADALEYRYAQITLGIADLNFNPATRHALVCEVREHLPAALEEQRNARAQRDEPDEPDEDDLLFQVFPEAISR